MGVVLYCLKNTSPSVRTESTYQSIDATVTKSKGRLSMKQYVPLKLIIRGPNLRIRCVSNTACMYDTNIYLKLNLSLRWLR